MASMNLVLAASFGSLDLEENRFKKNCFLSPLPEISLQDHDVLHLYLFQPVPLDQSVKVSIENQDKSQQGNKDIFKLNPFLLSVNTNNKIKPNRYITLFLVGHLECRKYIYAARHNLYFHLCSSTFDRLTVAKNR